MLAIRSSADPPKRFVSEERQSLDASLPCLTATRNTAIRLIGSNFRSLPSWDSRSATRRSPLAYLISSVVTEAFHDPLRSLCDVASVSGISPDVLSSRCCSLRGKVRGDRSRFSGSFRLTAALFVVFDRGKVHHSRDLPSPAFERFLAYKRSIRHRYQMGAERHLRSPFQVAPALQERKANLIPPVTYLFLVPGGGLEPPRPVQVCGFQERFSRFAPTCRPSQEGT